MRLADAVRETDICALGLYDASEGLLRRRKQAGSPCLCSSIKAQALLCPLVSLWVTKHIGGFDIQLEM
jgi:hypothetical protein